MDDIVGSPYFSLHSYDPEGNVVDNSNKDIGVVHTCTDNPYEIQVGSLTKNLVSVSISEARCLVTCHIENDTLTVLAKMPYRPYSSIKDGVTAYKLKTLDNLEFNIKRDRLLNINYRRQMSAIAGSAIIDMCLVHRALTDMYLNTLVSPFHSVEKKEQTIAFNTGDGLIDFSTISQEEISKIRKLLMEFESPGD